jgi:hypothetical protein
MIRDLTQQEIEAAPEWAVKYWVMANHGGHRSGNICFVNKLNNITQWQGSEKCGIPSLGTLSFKQIPRKEFDISEYEFSDCDIELVELVECGESSYLHFDFKQETNELTHSKCDVIAMAKALKLTASDLS